MREYEEWEERRDAAQSAVDDLLRQAASVAVEHGLHEYGDGEGGCLFDSFRAALEEALGAPLHPVRPASGRKRAPISLSVRAAVFARDGLACVRCGESSFALLSIDHVVPHSKGGSDGEENLRTLCRRCNSSRGNRMEVGG